MCPIQDTHTHTHTGNALHTAQALVLSTDIQYVQTKSYNFFVLLFLVFCLLQIIIKIWMHVFCWCWCYGTMEWQATDGQRERERESGWLNGDPEIKVQSIRKPVDRIGRLWTKRSHGCIVRDFNVVYVGSNKQRKMFNGISVCVCIICICICWFSDSVCVQQNKHTIKAPGPYTIVHARKTVLIHCRIQILYAFQIILRPGCFD